MKLGISRGGLIDTWHGLSLGISPVLAFLLVVLTPVGTGQGVHADQLLDPVCPHLHFLGTVVRQGAAAPPVQRSVTRWPQGLALGAAAGASEASLIAGLTPVVPGRFDLVPDGALGWRLPSHDGPPAGVTADPPPNPPPIAHELASLVLADTLPE